LEQIETHIARINTKLQDLLKKHASLQKQNQQQQELIAKLKEQQDSGEKKIKALEEQQYILKSAAGELNSTDKKAFEQTISRYIKEIDKCIALLSE
jgi:peptidoglycan hydrolase CwlO-like protein